MAHLLVGFLVGFVVGGIVFSIIVGTPRVGAFLRHKAEKRTQEKRLDKKKERKH